MDNVDIKYDMQPSTSVVHRLNIFMLPIACFAIVFFIGTVIFGAYINFSPVPFADSWNGMIDFYIQAQKNPAAWWSQHNEHRIFFSKFLFWLDMRHFGGIGLLLVPANIILLMLTWWLLFSYSKRFVPLSSPIVQVQLGAMLCLLCFSWMQNQNIIWSFQSQFILVYLFPLLSFYCMAIAQQAKIHALRWKGLSILLGVSSAYCMVNGVFALPILAVLSWLTERSLRWFGIIIVCTGISLIVFLIDYQRAPGTGMSLLTLQTSPLKVILFALAYLGGPFLAIFGKMTIAIGAGAIAILLWSYLFLYRSVYQPPAFALALLAYVAYIFATAIVTAFGRAMFPIEIAGSSRYLTPTLFMWGAMLVLLMARSRYPALLSCLGLVLLLALLTPGQLKVFKINTTMLTPQVKAVAALSLKLNINDHRANVILYPFFGPEVEGYYKRARESQVSIFSKSHAYPINQVGRPLAMAGGVPCLAQVTFSNKVDKKPDAFLVGGTLNNDTKNHYRFILFGDALGMVKGVAIPGRDMTGPAGRPGPLNFDGYLFTNTNFNEVRCIK